MNLDIEKLNKELKSFSPDQIIEWAITQSKERIVTTSFGIYSAVLLSTFHRKDPNIKVIWCDTLFNNDETYKHASNVISKYQLNIQHYKPMMSKEVIEATLGVPELSDPKHEEFTEIVKLEPFRRAITENNPKIWFTNIRVRQNEYRNSKDILSYSKDGILKVSPFYYWTDQDLDAYITKNKLPKNTAYFDPTKVLTSRECGIHFQ
ncbi:phosphoadenylylsulfate reductase (thioredoxin) [Flavobacteriaceae bacterium MAR_2010_188]|nr:phosphoadenylylsulfate reductase (thioredoxin) [Flavobacteriaceae bacterium MAR_2010_188]